MTTAIKITERWAVYRDPYQWVLVETYEGKDKHGNPKAKTRETYHPWLDQAMRWAAEKDCEGAPTLSDVSWVYTRLIHAMKDATGPMERWYAETYAELSETRRALKQAQADLRKLRKREAA